MASEVKVLSVRPKKFRSMESLWFEEERLATFINWPVKHISYTALAAEGFYYLRTKDHCACAFCRGIIGAWEMGDTPRGEHKRHFPHCPIIRGRVTGNVPLALGKILNKLPKEPQQDLELDTGGKDVCGTENILSIFSNGLPFSHERNKDVSMESLGFKEYSGPKRKDYLTVDGREKSFQNWPEGVEQTPRALAEAGFYYCGLSDHVRCFHCGNGLRNWENHDSPWGEHARWYGDCNFVLLTKGKVFVDQVQRENPPFISSFASESKPREEKNAITSKSSSPCSSCSLSEEEMDQLMHLDTIREVVSMGFTARVARIALKRKLIQTGLPFFTMDAAIQSILGIMDEETKNTISGCEYITSQAKKMSSHTAVSEDIPPMRTNLNMAQDIPATAREEENNLSSSILSRITTLLENTSPPLRASTPASDLNSINDSGQSSESEQEEIISQATSEPEENSIQLPTNNLTEESTSAPSPVVMENVETSLVNVIEEENTSPSSVVMDNVETSLVNVIEEENTSPSSVVMDNVETSINLPETEQPTTPILSTRINQTVSMGEPLEGSGDEYLMESDEVTEDETKLSVPSKSSSSSSSSSQSSEGSHDSGFDKDMELDELSSQTKQLEDHVNNLSKTGEASSLAQELETLKENRQCRVCMDKEMDIVFLPCTHMVTCSSCALALSSCPICRSNIQYAFKPIIT